ncbi:hypothetical protein LUZ63_009443 [Rhynchospora breviuscula]|uniref:TPX2 central domain-containing protein n=1 Tax=Rhynchospora breviuscula TaxID=2022672 RepID=A0A9Q0HP54_9POAL|nr:hypothetical protein LUZ63_009443 [Rhynchospora breviuscula]
MDEEMPEAIEADCWLDFDVDLDYEYDAPKYFDLSTEEPLLEASSAEKWFDTAETYPPSPLIMKIVCGEDLFSQDVDHNPDTEVQHNPSESDVVIGFEDEIHRRIIDNAPKVKHRVKSYASKVSTLMKPTASYLAKKTQRYEPTSLIRNNKLNTFNSLESSGESKDCTIQAAKRQRLEKGHLSKATGTAQPDLIHKTRVKADITRANGNVGPARTRITIPRQPELQTMRRAERSHARRGLINAIEPEEQHMQPKATLKTHPSSINESNLANQSRVLGDSSGLASKAVQGCDRVFRRSDNRNPQNSQLNSANHRQECRNSIFFFKARISGKKVAPSNGVGAISRKTKPQTTMPKEDKLCTGRRRQNPPPLTEVFNKLAITSEERHVSTSKTLLVPSAHCSKVFYSPVSFCTLPRSVPFYRLNVT